MFYNFNYIIIYVDILYLELKTQYHIGAWPFFSLLPNLTKKRVVFNFGKK